MRKEKRTLSLFELNNCIRTAVNHTFPDSYWVRAEMSDVRTNLSSGHCYLEFIEKSPATGQIVAKVRGTIWASTFCRLKTYFEMQTGQPFASGLKVLVQVTIEFHELYGFSLNVLDIDPDYTLGDMTRRRMEIIQRLKKEGVFELNKELPFPLLPQRIALITSPTAAGYGDFVHQLEANRAGYPFYLHLFPAIMQGEKTEESVIAALERIYHHADLFDVVVIIRGGGATSELNSFDTYNLAANCAQFPLPIITGIGHERDDTIVDLVAHTRMKTPTAVAEFLISRFDGVANELNELQHRLSICTTQILTTQKSLLQTLGSRLPSAAIGKIERNRSLLQTIAGKLPAIASGTVTRQLSMLDTLRLRLGSGIEAQMAECRKQLQLQEQFIRMASPEYILKRGYSLTLCDGKIIKQAAGLQSGDRLTTCFADGDVNSIIV